MSNLTGDGPARRIGVLGGTFDPPHIAHLVAAVNARAALDLEMVLLVVANEPWQKVGSRPVSPVEDRLAMTRAACRGVAGVEVDTIEIDRGGPSYTVDTLEALARRQPDDELFLIVGADAAAGLGTWERADELARWCHLVVVDRPGPSAEPVGGPVPPPAWSGTTYRVDIPHLGIASTDLRARVAAYRPLDFLVPAGVAEYIEAAGLYRGHLD